METIPGVTRFATKPTPTKQHESTHRSYATLPKMAQSPCPLWMARVQQPVEKPAGKSVCRTTPWIIREDSGPEPVWPTGRLSQ